MFLTRVIPAALAATLLFSCSHQGGQHLGSQDEAEMLALRADYDASVERCKALANRSPGTWATTYWTCNRDEDRVTDLKYDMPNPDLREFRYDYIIAIARREDAGLITPDEAKTARRRVTDAVSAEAHRRIQAKIDAYNAERRADSLSALASNLGAIVRNQPPPPETTLYNFGGTAVTCTRWQNVVSCF